MIAGSHLQSFCTFAYRCIYIRILLCYVYAGFVVMLLNPNISLCMLIPDCAREYIWAYIMCEYRNVFVCLNTNICSSSIDIFDNCIVDKYMNCSFDKLLDKNVVIAKRSKSTYTFNYI